MGQKKAPSTKKPAMSFDEACEINIPEFAGLLPANLVIWKGLMTDLAESLYTWTGNIDFYDLLLIERFIHQKKKFCMVRTKYKKGKAIINGNIRIVECTPVEYGVRGRVTKVRITLQNSPRNLIMTYGNEEFVLFEDFSYTRPELVVNKYSEMLGKLDALYAQNVDKLSIPIIGVVYKSLKNELLNLFRRAKMNALYTLVNGDNKQAKANELFYNPEVEFILDKINVERETLMKEFLQEQGVNPNNDVRNSTQYTNTVAIKESSLISKYFSASMNKYRTHFEKRCNEVFEDVNLSYHATVKTYSEEYINGEISE